MRRAQVSAEQGLQFVDEQQQGDDGDAPDAEDCQAGLQGRAQLPAAAPFVGYGQHDLPAVQRRQRQQVARGHGYVDRGQYGQPAVPGSVLRQLGSHGRAQQGAADVMGQVSQRVERGGGVGIFGSREAEFGVGGSRDGGPLLPVDLLLP